MSGLFTKWWTSIPIPSYSSSRNIIWYGGRVEEHRRSSFISQKRTGYLPNDMAFAKYQNMTMYVGTSDTESTLKFYYRLGFKDYDIRQNFFISQYEQPIYDNGKLLIDMKILKKDL